MKPGVKSGCDEWSWAYDGGVQETPGWGDQGLSGGPEQEQRYSVNKHV